MQAPSSAPVSEFGFIASKDNSTPGVGLTSACGCCEMPMIFHEPVTCA